MGASGGDRAAAGMLRTVSSATLSRRSFLAAAGLGTLGACSRGLDVPSFSVPERKLYYGAGMPPDNLRAFESRLGRNLPCYRSYFKAGEEAELERRVESDLAAGRLPMTSIKPPGSWEAAAKNG